MDRKLLIRLLAVLLGFALFAAACGDDGDGEAADDDATADDTADDDTADSDDSDDTVDVTQGGGVLAKVLDAGTLECGVNDTLPGFGIIDADGEYSGFDIDFCRAIAAALFDDPDAVNYTPLVPAQRFPTLQSGEIDVLIRNTTRTASRSGNEQANFVHTTFYDGQGFMVRDDSTITTLDDVADATICVLTGTTTLLNLNAVLGDRGIPFTPVEFESNDELNPAFVAEQCEVWTSDASQLASFAATLPVDTRILPDIISKEPLGPVVLDGDTEWAQAVDWITMATVQLWEFGVDSTNIDSFADNEDSNIRRFLGLPITDEDGNESIVDVGLGLPTDFATRIVTHVGNYKEIFDRNLGPLGLQLEGTDNDLWRPDGTGGLQYVPPFR